VKYISTMYNESNLTPCSMTLRLEKVLMLINKDDLFLDYNRTLF